MNETIISWNGPNILTIFGMGIIGLAFVGLIMKLASKAKADADS